MPDIGNIQLVNEWEIVILNAWQSRQSKEEMKMVKFSEMPKASVDGWVLWAQSHNWGSTLEAWFDEMTGELVTYYCDDINGAEEARHATPKQLKQWAGY